MADEEAARPDQPAAQPDEPTCHPTCHPTWLELFFDLVVVAAIAQLAHRLQASPGPADLGFFVRLYLAIWIGWTSFTLYANVAGERTRREAMLLGMVGIAIMAAAVPEATGDRAAIFGGAYVAVRLLAVRSWALTRRMLLAWPSVQGSVGVSPWFASICVGPPARYALWGLGLAVDVLLPIAVSRRGHGAPGPAVAPTPGAGPDATGAAAGAQPAAGAARPSRRPRRPPSRSLAGGPPRPAAPRRTSGPVRDHRAG